MRKHEPDVLQKLLHRLVRYNPDTGLFIALRSIGNVRKGGYRGNHDPVGYMRFSVDGRQYMSHVLAWVYTFGSYPLGQIDHINGVKDDNRISNLRDVSPSINQHNKPTNASSGVAAHRKRFKARIGIGGRRVHLGIFASQEEASAAYANAKQKILPPQTAIATSSAALAYVKARDEAMAAIGERECLSPSTP